jgi:ABC-type branched-subunit amino acid transport system ATPase component
LGPEKPSSVLRTNNLVKNFGGITVANKIDFSMSKGELRCLVGPNGAGKTTFFNLITGIIRPSEGDVFFMGRNITNLSTHRIARLGIARSFQVPNIYNGLSVTENIQIAAQQKYKTFNPLSSNRVPNEIINMITGLLDRFHLIHQKDSQASKLSHGEKRRLELAISLACEPKLLLLDEPCAGLTVAETEEIGRLIKDLSSQSISILLIEHDTKFVKKIADTITVLHRGEIVAEGSPEEIEKDEYVKDIYLGGKQAWY